MWQVKEEQKVTSLANLVTIAAKAPQLATLTLEGAELASSSTALSECLLRLLQLRSLTLARMTLSQVCHTTTTAKCFIGICLLACSLEQSFAGTGQHAT